MFFPAKSVTKMILNSYSSESGASIMVYYQHRHFQAESYPSLNHVNQNIILLVTSKTLSWKGPGPCSTSISGGEKNNWTNFNIESSEDLKVFGRIHFPGTRCVWSIYLHEWLVCLMEMINVHSIVHRLYTLSVWV